MKKQLRLAGGLFCKQIVFTHKLLALLLMLLVMPAQAQRVVQSINANWLFSKAEGQQFASSVAPASGWEKISLPHTWNAADVLDDEPGYYLSGRWLV